MTIVINFTKSNLEKIPLSEKGRILYRDEKERYLFLFVTPKNKTYYYYRKYFGSPKQIKIGNFKTITLHLAKSKVADYSAMIANGTDPMQERLQEKQQETLRNIFDLYINERRRNDALKNDIHKFNKYVKDFHNRKISSITYSQIKSFHRSLSGTPYLANRVLELLNAVFNFAKKELRLDISNPCVGVKKNQEFARERILNEAELHRYRNICKEWAIRPNKAMYSDIFMLLLYTGQRKTNVLQMKFSDIDLITNTWTIPAAEFKNKDSHTLPLMTEAVVIIHRRHLQLKNKSKYVFPSPVLADKPIFEISRQWKSFLKESEISDLTRHDMRRTSGSIILMMTGNLKLVQKFLGHKNIATTAKVYSHIWENKMSEAIENAFKNITSSSDQEKEKTITS